MAIQTEARVSGPSALVRRAILGDAILSALSGLFLVAACVPVSSFLGLDSVFLVAGFGIVCLGWAAALLYFLRQHPLDLNFATSVVALNVVLAAGTAFLALDNLLSLSTEGRWGLAVAALLVADIALVQFVGVRKARRSFAN